MTDADAEKFAAIVSGLAVAFNRPPSETLTHAYWLALRDLDFADVERAAAHALATSKFMPVPSELRAHVRGDATVRAGAAWERVIAQLRHRSGVPDDPALLYAVRVLGGWHALGQRDSEQLHAHTRREFERLYVAYEAAPVEQQRAIEAPRERARIAGPETAGEILGRLLPWGEA